MMVVVFMPVKRERATGAAAKQFAVCGRCRDNIWRPFATYMPVQTNNPVRHAHYDVQFMADHKNGAAKVAAHIFDLSVETC